MTLAIIILIILALVLLLAFVGRPPALMNVIEPLRSLVQRERAARAAGPQTVLHEGEEIAMPPARSRRLPGRGRRRSLPWLPTGRRRRWGVLVIATLIGAIGIANLPFLTDSQANRFVVLIAPFRTPDGGAQGGRAVADQLAALLPERTQGRVIARVLSRPPGEELADLTEVPALLGREGADALLWGDLTSGGLLDQQSLRPLLVYQPNGAYAPAGWYSYLGRFAMPDAYYLSAVPLNGQAVLPDLLGALADYGAGRYDNAFSTLDTLTQNYPELAQPLPRAIRGNILWARGEFDAAAGEYRRTGVMDAGTGSSPQLAALANNLGAILLDASAQAEEEGDRALGDAQAQEARAAFARAEALLGDLDLGALRTNQGLAALRAGRSPDATQALERARQTGGTTFVLIQLAGAYRITGQYGLADGALSDAAQQISLDIDRAPTVQRPLLEAQLNAQLSQERALLRVADALDAREPLLWELERMTVRVRGDSALVEEITAARGQLERAADSSADINRRWQRRSASEDAANHPIAGMVATGQARRVEQQEREQRRWLAALNTELGRLSPQQRGGMLSDLWVNLTGDRSPLGQARASLEEQLRLEPQDLDAQILLGRALWLNERTDEAQTVFARAAEQAPARPEPVYGQAVIALRNDEARGRELLQRAIELEPRFYPAREKLAEASESAGDWPLAIEQRAWLAENYPNTTTRLALAHTLRQSGSTGYAQAEQILLPLANGGNAQALLELGRLYQSNGDLNGARAALELAFQQAPENPDVLYSLGQVYVAQDRETEAENLFKRAIRADAGYVQAHLALAQIYRTEGSAQAAEAYRAALESGVSDVPTLKEIGAALLASGAYNAAADAYRRALTRTAQDAELYHGLAQATLGQGDLEAARTAEQQALNLRPGYPEALVGLGDIALRQNNLAEAVQHYNEAIQQNSQLTSAYLGLGRAAAAEGNWSVAQGHFNSAVARDPESPDAQLWLGEARIRQNDIGGAISAYTTALTLRPTFPEAYFGLAQAQIAAGQTQSATNNLERALAQRPRYAEARLLQGKLYEQQNNLSAAIDAYGRAVLLNGDLAEPYYRRALLYLRTDRINEAQNDLERAVVAQDNFPEAHYWLGRTYLVNERPTQANQEFQKAITQRGGSYPEASFYQGLAQEQLGNREAAITSLTTALEQGRDSVWLTEAQAALARLNGEVTTTTR
ncbi:MAG TPA: tetratricopeptide repeat protein [Roseiflexaceae bacterium]|nr:tetratricopeptide repeat protein [Roseiflexaceae bacterium]